MNILLLSQFFSTTRGGGEYLFNVMAEMLAENGHNVWVVTNKIKGEDYKIHEKIKLEFVAPDLEYKGVLPGFQNNIRYSINAVMTGLRIIKKEKIDIIHSNNFAPALAGAVLSYLTSRPHITSVWDIFSLCGKDYWHKWYKQEGVSGMHSLLGSIFEKLILKLPHNAVHTISDATRDDLVKFGSVKPIYVIPPSIEKEEVLVNDLNSVQFVYVGRLVFYKNLEVVIKAISIVKKNEPKIKLVIIGDGPHRKILESLSKSLGLESNIEFKGYVSEKEKHRLIASSSALVFPSLCEGFGLVILEAFSQSKPVLVSDIRPMSDIVSHGKNGYVLNPHDETIWSEHLLKIIKNPQQTIMMGKDGNRLLSSYSQQSMSEKIIKMYNDVLDSHVKK